MAKCISNPILKIINVAKQISGGNYHVRIDEKTNTKETEMLIRSFNDLAHTLEREEKIRKQLTEIFLMS